MISKACLSMNGYLTSRYLKVASISEEALSSGGSSSAIVPAFDFPRGSSWEEMRDVGGDEGSVLECLCPCL